MMLINNQIIIIMNDNDTMKISPSNYLSNDTIKTTTEKYLCNFSEQHKYYLFFI